MRKQITRREPCHGGWARLIGVGLGLIVSMGPGTSGPARAAQMASKIKLSASDLRTPSGDPLTLAELAAKVAAAREAASASTRAASSTTPVPTSVPADTLLDPSTYIDPIMKSKLVKDLEHMVSVSKGKMSNLNKQSLDSLATDLGIKLPRSVAPRLAASSSKPTLEAQEIGAFGAGTPIPAPVPEPGTVVIFGLAAFALAARSRLTRRSPGV